MLKNILRDLVAIPSYGGEEAEIQEYSAQWLQASGFQVKKQYLTPYRYNLVAEKGEGPSVLLYAHVDTVAPVKWESDPLKLRESGDNLIGLGVSDMKSGIAIILDLAKTLPVQGFKLIIALTVDEEEYSQGAHIFIEQLKDMSNIKGILVPELSVDAPTETLGLGRKGHYGFCVQIKGEAKHGSLGNQSNPIWHMGQTLEHLKKLPLNNDPQFGSDLCLPYGLYSHSIGLSVPHIVELKLSYLAIPPANQSQIQSTLVQHLNALPFEVHLTPEIRPTPFCDPYWQSPLTPQIKAVHQLLKKTDDIPVSFGVSVADENILAKAFDGPILSLAPRGGNSHREEEWVSLRSIQRVRHWYEAIIKQWASSP